MEINKQMIEMVFIIKLRFDFLWVLSQISLILYLASENVVKKWTQRYRNWDQVLSQLILL